MKLILDGGSLHTTYDRMSAYNHDSGGELAWWDPHSSPVTCIGEISDLPFRSLCLPGENLCAGALSAEKRTEHQIGSQKFGQLSTFFGGAAACCAVAPYTKFYFVEK